MKEQVFRDQISSYLENDLKGSELLAFTEYLKNNPSFANEVEKVRNLILNLNSLNSTKTKNDFMYNLNSRIDMMESTSWARVLKFRLYDSKTFQKLSLAAAILVVISSSYILVNQNLNIDSNILAKQQDAYIEDYDIAQEESSIDTTNSNTSKIRLVGTKD